jgi:phage major head subunit gpT-like protein
MAVQVKNDGDLESTLKEAVKAALAQRDMKERGERVGTVGRFAGRHSLKTLNERGIQEFREEIKEEYRIDPEDALAEMMGNVNFSARRWQRSYREQSARTSRFGEANSASAFSQVLRYGITRLAAEGYELEPSVYENEVAEVVPSKGFENYYAPFFRPGRGGPVERGQAYPEVKMSGLNVTIRNYKFGSVLELERELVDDDQTGEVVQQGSLIGESLTYEMDMFGFGQMYATSWTYSVSVNTGAISTPQVKEAHRILRKVHDPNGNLLVIKPDTLLVDSDEELEAVQVMDSWLLAQNPGATPTAGTMPYFGTINPLRGKYRVVGTPWMSEAAKSPTNANGYGTDGATPPKFLLRAKKRIILQTRNPLEVVQEAPNSGTSFRQDVLAYKGRMRFGAGTVDNRYACRLN